MTSIVHVAQPTALARQDEPMDLASLTEQEFERGLQRIETTKRRMQRILETTLVPGAHYGNPKTRNGSDVFQKPILFQAGAEELQKGFRLQIALGDQPDEIVLSAEFVQVTVYRAILDISGRVLDRTSASCSSKEKRFKKRDGSGFVYDDARETLNDCHAMAEKRAKVRLVRSALGLTAFLANEEEMEAALEAADNPLTPMTDEEKKQVYSAATARGIGKKSFAEIIEQTLGRQAIGTGGDVKKVLAAIAAWQPAAPAPAAAPASTPPKEETPEELRAQDRATLEADQRAEQGGLSLGDAQKRRPNAVAEGR